MSRDIVITAEDKNGEVVPASAPWKHELDDLHGVSRDALAEAIRKRVIEHHLADGSEIHVVDKTGETIIDVPALRAA